MIRVAAGVVARRGRVLVCRRRADADHGGKWEFPGGKIEAGESAEAALRRELAEELGIEAEIGRELWRTAHRYPGRRPVELRFFLVIAFRGRLRNRVFDAVRWAGAGRLSRLDFLEADRALVAELDRSGIPDRSRIPGERQARDDSPAKTTRPGVAAASRKATAKIRRRFSPTATTNFRRRATIA